LKKWVNKKNILYFNLENDEIFPLELNDLNIILESYFEVTWKLEEKVYIFLDEIQEVDNWGKFVRKVLDNYPLVEIVITGSSSTLLSREIATNLRWRSINMEMLPLSFEEYLRFKNFSNKNIWNIEKIKLNI
jgi:predicted AAA+ superfamily ATPase